jgi:hypothetical protein
MYVRSIGQCASKKREEKRKIIIERKGNKFIESEIYLLYNYNFLSID